MSCHFLDLLAAKASRQMIQAMFSSENRSSIRNLDTERSLHKERWRGKKETQKQDLRLHNYQILWLSLAIRLYTLEMTLNDYITIYYILYNHKNRSHRLKLQNLVRLHVGHVLIEGQTNHWELGPVSGNQWSKWRRPKKTLRCSGFLQVSASPHSISYPTGQNQAESDSHRLPYPLRHQVCRICSMTSQIGNMWHGNSIINLEDSRTT